MKITIITKDDLRITYKEVVTYSFNNDVISISHTYTDYTNYKYCAAYTDHYKFRDLKGIIITSKRAKDADKR